jgi:O-antigen/teichoic acid export membrane protein
LLFLPDAIRRRIKHRPNLVRIVDNIGWLFLDKILRMGLGLFVTVLVARYLGPEQFGLLTFALAVVGLFGTLAALGLNGIVVRDLVRHPRSAEITLGTAAVMQFLGGSLAFGLAVWTTSLLRPHDQLLQTIVVVLAAAMLFKGTEIAVYWFEATVQSKYTVWVKTGLFLVASVVTISFVALNAPLVAFAWLILVETVLAALILIVVFAFRGPGFWSLRVRLERMVSLIRDSWPLMLSGLAIVVYMKIDQIMIGQLMGNDSVGIYSAAARISEAWYFIPMAVVASVFPAILHAKKKSELLYYQRLQKLYDVMVILSIAVAIPMTFLSDWMMLTLFGDAYKQAGAVLAIHIWASVFVFLGVASGKWFLAENRQMLGLQRTALGALVNVVLNFALIPGFGVVGAAVATVISQAIAALFYDALQSETRRMFHMKLHSFNIMRLLKTARI